MCALSHFYTILHALQIQLNELAFLFVCFYCIVCLSETWRGFGMSIVYQYHLLRLSFFSVYLKYFWMFFVDQIQYRPLPSISLCVQAD